MKKVLLGLLAILSLQLSAQHFTKTEPCQESVYIYKLSVKQAVKFQKIQHKEKKVIKLLEKALPYDTLKLCDFYKYDYKAPVGNYVSVVPWDYKYYYDFIPISNVGFRVIERYGKFTIQLKDSIGKQIKDATILIKGKKAALYNKRLKSYEIPQSKKNKYHFLIHKGDTTILETGSEKPYRWSSKATKKKEHRGYFVLSQPKYRPGDTLRGKVFLLKKEGKFMEDSLHVEIGRGYYSSSKSFRLPLKNKGQGVYELESRLLDSLEIDYSYNIKVYDQKGNSYLNRANFRLEDYELPEYKTSFRVPKNNVLNGENLVVFARLFDQNGFNVHGAKVSLELSLRHINGSDSNLVVLPKTIEKKWHLLDPTGETRIEIPMDKYWGNEVNLYLEAQLKAPGSFFKNETEYIYVRRKKYALSFELRKDSVFVKAYHKGKPYEGNFNVALKFAGKESEERVVHHNDFILINNQLESLKTKLGNTTRYFQLRDEYSPELTYLETKDSTTFLLRNQLNTKTDIYLNQGKTDRLIQCFSDTIFTLSNNGKQGYFTQYVYDKKGDTYLKYAYEGDKEPTGLQLIGDPIVYPGKKVEYTVKATNYSGKPLKNIDLTVVGVNSKFWGNPDVEYKSYSSGYSYKEREMTINRLRYKTDYFTEYDKGTERFERLWSKEQQHLRKHGFIVKELPSGDSSCYVEPHFVKNGKEKPFDYFQSGYDMYYTEYWDNMSLKRFPIKPGKINLIKKGNWAFVLDTLTFKKGVHYQILIKAERLYFKGITTYENKKKTKDYERNYRFNHTALFHTEKYTPKAVFELTNFNDTDTVILYNLRPGKVYKIGPIYHANIKAQLYRTNDTIEYKTPFRKGIVFSVEKGIAKQVPVLESMYNHNVPHYYGYRKSYTNRYRKSTSRKTTPQYSSIKELIKVTMNNRYAINYCSLLADDKNNYWILAKDTNNKLYTSEQFHLLKDHEAFVNLDGALSPLQTPETFFKGKTQKDIFWGSKYIYYKVRVPHRELHERNRGRNVNFVVVDPIGNKLRFGKDFYTSSYTSYNWPGKTGHIRISSSGYEDCIIPNFHAVDSFEHYFFVTLYPNDQQQEVKDDFEKMAMQKLYDSLRTQPTFFKHFRQSYPSSGKDVWDLHGVGTTSPFTKYYFRNSSIYGVLGTMADHKELRKKHLKQRIFLLEKELAIVAKEEQEKSYYMAKREELANVRQQLETVSYTTKKRKFRLGYKSSKEKVAHRFKLSANADAYSYAWTEDEEEVSLVKGEALTKMSGVYSLANNSTTPIDALYIVTDSNGAVASKDGKFDARKKNKNATDQMMQELIRNGSIRKQFKDCAIWQPYLKTDTAGLAKFTVTFPDNITAWKVSLFGMDKKGNYYNNTDTKIKSYKPVVANADVPRFLTENDQLQFYGKTLNYTIDHYKTNRAFLINGKELALEPKKLKTYLLDSTSVKANGEEIKLGFKTLLPNGYWDAEERKVPVHKQGIGVSKTTDYFFNKAKTLSLELQPGEYKIFVSNGIPAFAEAAAERLIHYPYACNEQMTAKLTGTLIKQLVMQQRGDDPNRVKKATLKYSQKRLIKRLLKSRNEDDLWGWWSKQNTDIFLSMHILDLINKRKDLGFKYNNTIEDSYISLWSYVRDNNQLSNSKKLYAAYIITTKQRNADLKQLMDIYTMHPKNPTEFILKERVKQLTGDTANTDSILALKKYSANGGYYWEGDSLRNFEASRGFLTRIAYEIFKEDSMVKEMNLIKKSFLIPNTSSYALNTYETTNMLWVLMDELKSKAKASKIETNGALKLQAKNNYQGASVSIKKPTKLTVNVRGDGMSYLNIKRTEWLKKPSKHDSIFNISTTLTFKGKEVRELERNQTYDLNCVIKANETVDYVMVKIPLPAGCRVLKDSNFGEIHREYYNGYVNIYYNRLPKGTTNLSIKLAASFAGKFNINPAQVESMYFSNLAGWDTKKVIEIK